MSRLSPLVASILIVACFALVVILAGCGGGGTDADGKPDQTIDPPDCKANPESCK